MDNDMQMEVPVGKSPMRKRGLTIGLAAGLLGGTAAGLVFGVPGLTSAATPSAIVRQVDDPATDPATDAAADAAEDGTRLRAVLQPLVDDGTITAEQADAVTAHLIESRPERGPGWFGRGGHGRGGHGPIRDLLRDASDAVTGVLGIDADTLRRQLMDGSTLAEIATANDVEPQAVIDALVADANTRIDQAVTDGKIDSARAEELKANVTEMVTAVVNGERPALGGHGGFPGFPGGPDRADDDDQVPATTEN